MMRFFIAGSLLILAAAVYAGQFDVELSIGNGLGRENAVTRAALRFGAEKGVDLALSPLGKENDTQGYDLVVMEMPIAQAEELVGRKEGVIIAYDAALFIVSPDNPVANLTSGEVKKIYSGKITYWDALTDSPYSMHKFGLAQGRFGALALRSFVGEAFTVKGYFPTESADEACILTAGNPNAIAFVPFRSIAGFDDLKVLGVDGVMPSATNIRNHTYPVATAVVAQAKEGARKGNADAFIAYLLSDEGQALLAARGLLPLQTAGKP